METTRINGISLVPRGCKRALLLQCRHRLFHPAQDTDFAHRPSGHLHAQGASPQTQGACCHPCGAAVAHRHFCQGALLAPAAGGKCPCPCRWGQRLLRGAWGYPSHPESGDDGRRPAHSLFGLGLELRRAPSGHFGRPPHRAAAHRGADALPQWRGLRAGHEGVRHRHPPV